MEYLKDTVIEGNVKDIYTDNGDKVMTVGVVQNLNYHDYTKFKVGDEVKMRYRDEEENNYTILCKIGCILNMDSLNKEDGMITTAFIMNQEIISKYYPYMEKYESIGVSLEESNKMSYEEGKKKVKELVAKQGITNTSVKCVAETNRNNNRFAGSIFMMSLGFIICIVVVSICNLINVMKMNVVTRKNEIGVMRAIGLGENEVKDMLKAEGIIYGAVSSILGCLVSFIITLVFYIVFRSMFGGRMQWTMPLLRGLLVCVVTTIVITLTSILSGRSLFKESIVDSIRTVD